MAHLLLNGAQVNPSGHQMGAVAMAQSMDRNVLMDIAIQYNDFKRFLQATPIHGLFGLTLLLGILASGKQPSAVSMGRPVFTQGIQCEFG